MLEFVVITVCYKKGAQCAQLCSILYPANFFIFF